jgi:hypothetical protein
MHPLLVCLQIFFNDNDCVLSQSSHHCPLQCCCCKRQSCGSHMIGNHKFDRTRNSTSMNSRNVHRSFVRFLPQHTSITIITASWDNLSANVDVTYPAMDSSMQSNYQYTSETLCFIKPTPITVVMRRYDDTISERLHSLSELFTSVEGLLRMLPHQSQQLM